MNEPSNLLKAVLDQVNDGVYFVDPQRRIILWNRAAERITGYNAGCVCGQFCMSNLLMHVNDAGERLCLGGCPLAQTLIDQQVRETQVYLHHADGHRVPVVVRVAPVVEDGKVVGAVEVFNENVSLASAIVRMEELRQTAMRDELTGIANRRSVQSRLELAHQEWVQRRIPYAALMIDIDHFKQVNDRWGHETGDRVIQMVARSMLSGLRSYDYIGRWGGEEFMAVVVNVNPGELKVIAERVRMLVEQSLIFLDQNSRMADNSVNVTISVGGALARLDDSVSSVLARADAHLYHSKENGRNRVTLAVEEDAR